MQIRSNLPQNHLKAILDAATFTNTPIAIRPVNKFAKSLLAAGYWGKPFFIKNNTADSGPMASQIAKDPKYARLDDKSISPRADYSKKLKKGIQDGKTNGRTFNFIPLTLTQARIEELCELKAMTAEKQTDGTYLFTWHNQGEKHTAIGITKDEAFIVGNYAKDDKTFHPIEILGEEESITKEIHPFTSDYDLFLVAPHFSVLDLNYWDDSPHRTQNRSLDETRQSLVDHPREIAGLGNITPRLVELLQIFNNFIAAEDPLRRLPDSEKKEPIQPTILQGTYTPTLSFEIHLLELEDKISKSKLDENHIAIPSLIKSNNKYYFYSMKNDTTTLTEIDEKEININFQQKKIIVDKSFPLYQILVRHCPDNIPQYVYWGKPYYGPTIKPGFGLFLHNQEIYNPHAKSLIQNLPLIFFLPPIAGKEAYIQVVENEHEAMQLREFLLKNGYYYPTHKEYDKNFKTFRTSINEIELEITQQFKEFYRLRPKEIKTSPRELTSIVGSILSRLKDLHALKKTEIDSYTCELYDKSIIRLRKNLNAIATKYRFDLPLHLYMTEIHPEITLSSDYQQQVELKNDPTSGQPILITLPFSQVVDMANTLSEKEFIKGQVTESGKDRDEKLSKRIENLNDIIRSTHPDHELFKTEFEKLMHLYLQCLEKCKAKSFYLADETKIYLLAKIIAFKLYADKNNIAYKIPLHVKLSLMTRTKSMFNFVKSTSNDSKLAIPLSPSNAESPRTPLTPLLTPTPRMDGSPSGFFSASTQGKTFSTSPRSPQNADSPKGKITKP